MKAQNCELKTSFWLSLDSYPNSVLSVFVTNVFQVLEVLLYSCSILLKLHQSPSGIQKRSSKYFPYLGSRRPRFWSSSKCWSYTLHLTGTEVMKGTQNSSFLLKSEQTTALSCFCPVDQRGGKAGVGWGTRSNAGWDGTRTAMLMEASCAHHTVVDIKQLPLYKWIHFKWFPKSCT